MFRSIGTFQYGPGIRAVLWVDQELADYYRRLIPKYHYAQKPMYPAHITVVRTAKETPTKMDAWGKYEGEQIEFDYQDEVLNDGTYFYLRVKSERLGDIREELGLPRYRFGDLGADMKCYHVTVANMKGNK